MWTGKKNENSGSNEETRAICSSPDIITLMNVMLLQCVEYIAGTQEARSADRVYGGWKCTLVIPTSRWEDDINIEHKE